MLTKTTLLQNSFVELNSKTLRLGVYVVSFLCSAKIVQMTEKRPDLETSEACYRFSSQHPSGSVLKLKAVIQYEVLRKDPAGG